MKNKIKKLWTKFRFYLIKKLGGCTGEIRVERSHAEGCDVFSEFCVSMENIYRLEYRNQQELRDYILSSLSMGIANEIVKRGIYEFFWCDSPMSEERKYRMKVKVVIPPDRPMIDELDFGLENFRMRRFNE